MLFDPNQPYTLDRLVRTGISVAIVIATIWVLGYLSDVLMPFVVAMLLAYFINPLVRFFQKRLRIGNRILSVIIALLLVTILLVGLCMLIIPAISQELAHMGELLRKYVSSSELRLRAMEYLPADFETWARDFAAREEVRTFFDANSLGNIANFVGEKVLPNLWGLFSGSISIVAGIVGLTLILLYMVFILMDYDKVMDGWKNLLPPSVRALILEIHEDVVEGMNSYFRAQAFVAFLVGIIMSIGFLIIGLPMAVGLGLFMGLLNLVPYLQILGFIPAAFFALMYSLETGTSFWVMIGLVLLVFTIAQVIQDAILVPRIMGNLTGLNSAVILLALSIWGKLLGILGLIIALPITTILWSYYKRFLKQRIETNQPVPLSAIILNDEDT
ncbi:MAG: AI-2E family transporter, partial [Chitinophagales bacterium]